MIETEKLRAAIWEADRHLQALDTAREDWNRPYPPPATIEELERDSEQPHRYENSRVPGGDSDIERQTGVKVK